MRKRAKESRASRRWEGDVFAGTASYGWDSKQPMNLKFGMVYKWDGDRCQRKELYTQPAECSFHTHPSDSYVAWVGKLAHIFSLGCSHELYVELHLMIAQLGKWEYSDIERMSIILAHEQKVVRRTRNYMIWWKESISVAPIKLLLHLIRA